MNKLNSQLGLCYVRLIFCEIGQRKKRKAFATKLMALIQK